VIQLRGAGPADADALLEIQRVASVAAFAHVFPPDRHAYPDAEVRALLVDRLEGGADVFVAEEDGRPVGFAAVEPGWLVGLYVHPEAQGRGVGGALLDEAVRRRRAAGDSELRLWTLEDNGDGRRFYEARGWRLAPETRVVPYPPHPIDVFYVLGL
jgi:GNAT superfamily N-acetyltransferase